MKLLDKFLGKKDEPPDFSDAPEPLGQQGSPLGEQDQDPYNSDMYSKDPLQDQSGGFSDEFKEKYPSFQHDVFGKDQQDFGKNQDVFSSDKPTNADRARSYAQSLSQPNESKSYGGVVTGHESQLILEKLDTIKAEMDAIKQRMMRIERYMDKSDKRYW